MSQSQKPVLPGNSPKPTDRDSLRDAPAALCESGPEGIPGASPSNTAPHNSNTALPDGFKLLRLAVDSLYLSFPGELNDASFSALQKLKTNAQSENLEQLASAQYPIGSHIFEVKDRGAGLFPFVLVDNAYRIQLSRPGKKLPMAYVQVSAHYLAHKTPREIQKELQSLLLELGDLEGHNTVSRIDLAADFSTPVVMDSWHRSAWVTRAMEIYNYAKDQQFTGWTIGMGGVIGCRLYNKIAEILHSGKTWAMDLWLPMGWKPGEDVWRLEFEFKRDFLKERGLGSLESVLDSQDFRFHDLRHTWASWHRQQAGTSCDELKDLGGWKSREMVDRYAKYGTEHLAVAAMRIQRVRAENVSNNVTFLSRSTMTKGLATG